MTDIVKFPEPTSPANKELQDRKKEQLKKLPQFRGEVMSKNSIRQLPDVRPGQIFWVDMDGKAYVVAEIDGKKMTIKALDETATISTGVTVYDMNKNIVAKEPLFDFEKDGEQMGLRLASWFNNDCPPNTFYMLYGRDIHYVSLIQTPAGWATKSAFDQLVELLKPVGDLISMDFNTEESSPCVEIWVRTADSPAELLYLMPYDIGIVNFV